MRQRVFVLLYIVIHASVSTVWTDSWNVELVGREPFGPANDVCINGDYAYLCAGGTLVVLDVSNVANPMKIGRINTPGVARGVNVSNGYAYIADGDAGLRVIDVSNPVMLHEVGFCDTPGYAQGVYVSGRYAYVADDGEGMCVIDISNPSDPHEVGFCDTPGDALAVHVTGNYVYVADGYGGLQVIDISDPSDPHKAGFCDTPGYARGVYVSGDYAYVADGILRAIDISDPTNPHEVGFYDTPGYTQRVYVSGSYAYLACVDDDWGGLRVIDISDPSDLHQMGFCNSAGYAQGVYVSGGYAYVADDWGGLRVIDISNPSDPHEVGFYGTPGRALAVHVIGNYVYVADGYGGLRVIDISDPSNPHEVGFCDTPGYTRGVCVSGSYAYLVDGILRVIDISDPSDPREVGSCDTSAQGVYVSGKYAYVVDGGTFSVIDISDPANPREVASTPGGGGFHVVGNYAYVAGILPIHPGPDPPVISSGFRVIDISDPTNPHEVFLRTFRFVRMSVAYATGNYAYLLGHIFRATGISDPGDESAVHGSEGYAYTSGSGSFLLVIDVSNPSEPRDAGFFDIPGADVHVSGTYAYVTCYGGSLYDGSLCVLDISNLENICEVGFYDTPGDALNVYVVGNYAYVADGIGGLCILRYTGSNIESYSIRLNTGWNLISLPISPLHTDLTWVMSPLDGKYKFIYSYDSVSNAWLKYITQWDAGKNSLHYMDTHAGYWIYMEDSMDLPIQGTSPNPDIKLKAGWNLVGYSSLIDRRAEDCMSSVADSISSVWEYDATTGWAVYVPGGPSDLILMRPGYGYWIKAIEGCTWDIGETNP